MELILVLFLVLFEEKPSEHGSELFLSNCASCHGEDRLGKSAPPLFPPILLKNDEEILKIIKEGTITGMPSFSNLKEGEIRKIIDFIKKPVEIEKIRWDESKINESKHIVEIEKVDIRDAKYYTLFVERGKNLIWVIEKDKVLLKFPFPNIHGGIKFSTQKFYAYIPSRDGWIGQYSPFEGLLRKVRVCIYMRNLAVWKDGSYIAVSCWIPSRIIILENDLGVVKTFDIDGKINAVYELYEKPSFIFTLKNKPYIGFIDLENQKFSIRYFKIDAPIDDFNIDPFEEYLIASTSQSLKIYSLKTMELIREIPTYGGLPHLASASFWYSNGEIFFVTPIIKKTKISIFRAYKWEHLKDIEIQNIGFLARTNYKNPYVWIDTSSPGKIILLDKQSLDVKVLDVYDNKRVSHSEFSGDGDIVYLSVSEKDGSLVILDALKLQKIAEFPAVFGAGKYNFLNKNKKFESAMLGYQVFMSKCWGCHSINSEAFGPSLTSSSQKRNIDLILAQILNPERTHKILGYERNAMPKINLTEQEIKALMKFIEIIKEGWVNW